MGLTVTFTDGATTYTPSVLTFYSMVPGKPTGVSGDGYVTETLEVVYDLANGRLFAQAMNRVFQKARDLTTLGRRERPTINIKVTDTDTEYNSYLVDGYVTKINLDQGTYSGKYRIELSIKREAVWRNGVTWTMIPLANDNTVTPDTGFINVYNCLDHVGTPSTQRDNHVLAAADAVASGDIPLPVLWFLRAYPSVGTIKNLWIGQNVNNVVVMGDSIVNLEAEAGSGGTVISANPAYSNSGGMSLTMPAGGSGVTWTSATIAASYNGDWAVCLARLNAAAPAGTRARVSYLGVYGPWKDIGNHAIGEIGAIRIPPGQQSAMDATSFTVQFWNAAGGTIYLDFVQFWPMDGVRRLTGMAVASGDYLVIDDWGRTARGGTSTGTNMLNPGVGRIEFAPMVAQQFYFLHEVESVGVVTAPIASRIGVSMRVNLRRRVV